MSNLKLSEQQIQSLLQQDTQRHLEKLAKKNRFNLFLYRNKWSKNVPLDQQFLAFQMAKKNVDQRLIQPKVIMILLILSILMLLYYFYPTTNQAIKSDYILWFSCLWTIFMPTLNYHVQVRSLYQEALQTYLATHSYSP